MQAFDWQNLMARWNAALLADSEIDSYVEPEVIDSSWLGFPGATEGQIAAAQHRLGVSLPPSYREFLKHTNGWRILNFTIERLWSTEEVEWFAVNHQRIIDAWQQEDRLSISDEEYFVYDQRQDETAIRVEYLQSCLHISDTGDAADLLLNPEIVTSDGEWEGWFLAPWLPGAQRYRSFWDLMQATYQEFLERSDW